MSWIPVTDVVKSALSDLIATGAGLDPAATWVGVATTIVNNGVNTLMANVTEATGAMATRPKITAWSALHKLLSGEWVVDGPLCRFAPASSAEAQTLVAWFLADALTAGNLLGFGIINPAVVLADQTQEWVIVPRIGIANGGVISVESTFNG